MALKYLAGNRIVGTSGERIATTVQFGSDFTESGTGLDYCFTNESHIPKEGYSTNFTSTVIPYQEAGVGGANTANDNGDWTQVGTAVDIANSQIEFDGGSTGDLIYYDLANENALGSGQQAADNQGQGDGSNAWAMRFSIKFTSKADASYMNVGLSDNVAANNASQDHMGVQFRYTTGTKIFGAHHTNGSAPNGVAHVDGQTFDPTLNTVYYFEIERRASGESGNQGSRLTVRRYSDSTYSTVSQTSTAPNTSTSTQDLRYIKVMMWTDSNDTMAGVVDNIRFFDRMTALGQTHRGSKEPFGTEPTIVCDKMTINATDYSGGGDYAGHEYVKSFSGITTATDFVWEMKLHNSGITYAGYTFQPFRYSDGNETRFPGINAYGSQQSQISYAFIIPSGTNFGSYTRYSVNGVTGNQAGTIHAIMKKEGSVWTITNQDDTSQSYSVDMGSFVPDRLKMNLVFNTWHNYNESNDGDTTSYIETVSFVMKENQITDMPEGTIYEESDTGKHYMWAGSAWNEM